MKSFKEILEENLTEGKRTRTNYIKQREQFKNEFFNTSLGKKLANVKGLREIYIASGFEDAGHEDPDRDGYANVDISLDISPEEFKKSEILNGIKKALGKGIHELTVNPDRNNKTNLFIVYKIL